MVDINKGATRIQDREIRSNLTPVEIRELLRDANISEIKAKLPSGISKIDIENFLRNQYAGFVSQILQQSEIKSVEAAYPPPEARKASFLPTNPKAAMSSDDRVTVAEAMREYMDGPGFKAMSTKGSKGAGADVLSEQELGDMVDQIDVDVDTLVGETWSQIMDGQMMQDMERKTAEIKGEVDRIIALVKQGIIGPEFALIAMAKVHSAKNGVLFSYMGKKAGKLNEMLNEGTEDISTGDIGSLYGYQNTMREGTMNMNFLISDMQKVSSDIASTIEHVKSAIDMMNRYKVQMLQNQPR